MAKPEFYEYNKGATKIAPLSFYKLEFCYLDLSLKKPIKIKAIPRIATGI